MVKKSVIVFDSNCLLCNRCVQFIIDQDSKKNFLFTSLESSFSKSHVSNEILQDKSSLVLIENGKQFYQGEAIIRILKRLSFVNRVLAFFLGLLPSFLIDNIYKVVSKNRYRIFGRTSHCLILEDERIIK